MTEITATGSKETSTEAYIPQLILRKRKSGVAFLLMDAPGKANFLTSSLMDEFEERFNALEKDPDVVAIVCLSGKPDSFILGADLHEIMKFESQEQGLSLSRRGQKLFEFMSELSKPTVAGIHGACLGGGLELALWCDRRVATSAPQTELGLPEVKLGFVPGLGGTQMLPRVAGVKSALELIISAEPVKAERALELGVVDKLVAPDDLLEEVEKYALELCKIPKAERPTRAPALEPEKASRLFAMTERSVRIRTKGRYPAPAKAIEVVKQGLEQGLERGLEEEAKAFAELSVSEVSRNLVFLFFTTEFYRQSAVALGVKAGFDRNKPVGVLGAGLMGLELTTQSASSDFKVLLRAASKDRQKLAIERAQESLQQLAAKRDGEAVEALVDRLVSVEDDALFKEASIVIEACAEDSAVKVQLFKELASSFGEETVLATNTSSFSIAQLAERVDNAKNFLGLHFFHPIERMPLVELVVHKGTSKAAIGKACGFAQALGKIPLTVKDSPAFLVNRLLGCYVIEVGYLAHRLVPLNWLEDAALDFGMPMGPLTLMDEVGLDVANMVAQILHTSFGDRLSPPPGLGAVLKAGLVGKKTGEGIYMWDQSHKKLDFHPKIKSEVKLHHSDEKADREKLVELQEAMLLPMVDEAARCLEERVVRRAREIDMCMVLGLGFPAFRGGLLRWADTLTLPVVIEKLEAIYNHGEPKRSVSQYLKKLASEGRGFYSRTSEES